MNLQPYLNGLLDDHHLTGRIRIIQALAQLRKEWQETTGDQSLIKVQAPVGLLLSDIADFLNLTLQERHAMLGERLTKEIKAFTEQKVVHK